MDRGKTSSFGSILILLLSQIVGFPSQEFHLFYFGDPTDGKHDGGPCSVLVTTDNSVEIRWLSHFEEVEGS